MADAADITPELISVPTSVAVKMQFDRQRWFELFLVLSVAFARPIANSIYILKNGYTAVPGYVNFRWSVGIIEDIIALLMLGYVLSRRRLSFKDLGLSWSLKDVGIAVFLAFGARGFYFLGSMLISSFFVAIYGHAARWPNGKEFFGHPPIVAIPYFVLGPFFEEIIVRAFLMTEIAELTGSSLAAVMVSVAMQSAYHLYYGWTGAMALSFLFLVFALYYARTRRALPIVLAHEFIDVIALARIW
jgi:membrane protease YdiL (CAAX protease family)